MGWAILGILFFSRALKEYWHHKPWGPIIFQSPCKTAECYTINNFLLYIIFCYFALWEWEPIYGPSGAWSWQVKLSGEWSIILCGLAQSYRKLEPWYTAFRRGTGPADLGWNLISYLLKLVRVQRWTMDTSGEGHLPSPKRVVVCSFEKPGWDVTQKILKSGDEALWCNWSSANFNQGTLMVTALAFAG